jgi:hypothetical protein
LLSGSNLTEIGYFSQKIKSFGPIKERGEKKPIEQALFLLDIPRSRLSVTGICGFQALILNHSSKWLIAGVAQR